MGGEITNHRAYSGFFKRGVRYVEVLLLPVKGSETPAGHINSYPTSIQSPEVLKVLVAFNFKRRSPRKFV